MMMNNINSKNDDEEEGTAGTGTAGARAGEEEDNDEDVDERPSMLRRKAEEDLKRDREMLHQKKSRKMSEREEKSILFLSEVEIFYHRCCKSY